MRCPSRFYLIIMKREDQQFEIWFKKFVNGFCLEVNWVDLWNVRCQRVFPVSLISTPLFLTSLIILTKVL